MPYLISFFVILNASVEFQHWHVASKLMILDNINFINDVASYHATTKMSIW